MPGCGWHGSSVLESQPEDLDDVAELLGDCGASPGAPTAADAPPPHQLMSSYGNESEGSQTKARASPLSLCEYGFGIFFVCILSLHIKTQK